MLGNVMVTMDLESFKVSSRLNESGTQLLCIDDLSLAALQNIYLVHIADGRRMNKVND